METYSSLKLVASLKAWSKTRVSAWLGLGCAARSCDARQFFLDGVQVVLEPFGGHTDFFEHSGDDAFAVLKQGEQEMDGLEFGVAELGCALLCLLDRLLRLDGEFFPTNSHFVHS